MGKIRPAYCAGHWYTDDPVRLSSEINSFLKNVKNENLNVKAIIVPHAGYMYSGQVAAHSFKQINQDIKKIIILGTAHRYPLRGLGVMDYEFYNSPLGKVKVCNDIKNLLNEKNVDSVHEADADEHSIEIEIPFLQIHLKDICILPIIAGKVDTDYFSGLLEKYFDEKTVLVASVDLSHFHNYDAAVKLDKYAINCILNLNSSGIEDAEIDSPYAIMALIELAKKKNWKAKLLCYQNSGDITGDKKSVVGYSSIIFYENE